MPRQNPFQQLRFVSEGPEAEFEAICADLVRTQYPDSKRVRVHRGDGGVDTAHGEWGAQGALDVFQVKYFPGVLGNSQKQQIREAYATASNNPNFRLRNWILCLPTSLRQEDHAWFADWKADQDANIELWDGDKLEHLLRLPGAGRSRDRLKALGAVGTPAATVDLKPLMQVRRSDPSSGTGFQLQVSLLNAGDMAADNVRLIVRHTRETHHRANAPFPPWEHENQAHNPWELSLQRTLNPGETIPVIFVPFGVTAPLNGRIVIEITSRTTGLKKWYAEALEQDILGNARVSFVPDTQPWADDTAQASSQEPTFEPAKFILNQILEIMSQRPKGSPSSSNRCPVTLEFRITGKRLPRRN